MKILITGVNGFIANNLARYLQKTGCEVYGTSSKELKNSHCVDTFNLKIGDKLNIDSIDFDWAIHCVYDKNLSSEENTNATISWANELKNRGVEKQLFLSSIGAVSENLSEYAILKRKTEQWFLENDMYVVRPGLVVGSGGLFQQMIHKVKTFPIIPMIHGGKTKIKLIGINDLIDEIYNIMISLPRKKESNIFYPNDILLKELLEEISKYYNKQRIFISIPYFFMFYLARALEILNINIGVTSQNVKGLISNEIDIKSCIDYRKELKEILKESLES